MTAHFFVPGLPAPQGSKRHVGNGVMIESSAKVKPWREAVKAAALAERVAHTPGPVSIALHFMFPRPKSHYGTGKNAHIQKPSAPTWHSVKPDLDKLIRSTLDALTDCGLIDDDSRVVQLFPSKRYTDERQPGALITIRQEQDQ